MVSRTMRGPPQKGTQCCPRQRSLVYLRVCVYRHLNLEKVKEKKIWTQNAILFWKNKNMRTCGRPLQFNLVQVRFTRAQLFDAKAAPFFVRTRIYRPFERFIRRPWRLCSWYTTKKNKDKIGLLRGIQIQNDLLGLVGLSYLRFKKRSVAESETKQAKQKTSMSECVPLAGVGSSFLLVFMMWSNKNFSLFQMSCEEDFEFEI